ncbi:SMC-Scp complex subunit ScpB [Blastococcus sp. TF02A-26]|uniref:SMC-Scp complex subunit ScpB n=1 Tax=Blastococcus sp. TF02A-26 TaxID=2250577 RepID=UPI000DE8D0A8|nr:SMC-Scp complex subunit ScpB [Blastococcus sp. TF02A-26]RBY84680.1 SMC-Scp complex subunit ScpB [Blastococcus sp. TF02A-26]
MDTEGDRPPREPAPISWDALAAELAATREAAGERDDDPAVWDAVAAELAARVAERPLALPEEPPPVPAEEPQLPLPGLPPPSPEPAPEPELVVEVDPATLRAQLEALLFVLDSPVDDETLAASVRCPVARTREALAELAEDYDRRGAGITLRRVGEGWRLYTRDEHAEVIERYLGHGRGSRLTQAALETLAVIAYRQPVTRSRIAAIRGVGVDGVMRTLLARGLVQEVGSDPDSGGGLYGTTPLFLERLGLGSLTDLPDLGPLLPETATLLADHPDAH